MGSSEIHVCVCVYMHSYMNGMTRRHTMKKEGKKREKFENDKT